MRGGDRESPVVKCLASKFTSIITWAIYSVMTHALKDTKSALLMKCFSHKDSKLQQLIKRSACCLTENKVKASEKKTSRLLNCQ